MDSMQLLQHRNTTFFRTMSLPSLSRQAATATAAAIAASALVIGSAWATWADNARVCKHRRDMDNARAKYKLKDTSGANTTAVICNAQGLKLFVRHWHPKPGGKSGVRGVVVMVHGLTMHSGAFSRVAMQLVAQGLAVVSYDQQGHGLSDCFQGLRGYVRQF
ncbi:hypothetical protein Agub_g5978, partial [Astrephomene gubernaculifera]